MAASSINYLSLESPKRNAVFSILQIFAASMFLALCAQISLPLYFSPVPLSGQTFGVMLIGATMGSRKGLLSVFTYLVEGILGLPVFAGGSFGLMTLLGPCGGYFLGFIFQVYLVGWFIERQTAFQIKKILAILLFSCFIQLGLGVLWLASFVPFDSVMIMGFYPFLFGEIFKSILVSFYLKAQSKLDNCHT